MLTGMAISSATSDLDRVLDRLRHGDARAADEVFARFSGRLCGLVRAKVGLRYRRKFDPEDVMQSVFKSFFRMQAEGALAFDTWDALWALLSLIAVRKCGHRVEYLRSARRDVAREHSVSLGHDDLEGSRADLEALSREPTPSQAAMVSETLERLLASLGDRESHIVSLALQGYDTLEIAERVDRSTRTVQRVLEAVREQLERSADEDS